MMKTLAVIALLALVSTVPPSLPTVPYGALQAIPDEEIVSSTTQVTCPQGLILAFALHEPKTGYWMLWMTAQVWITEPEHGTRATTAIFGTWRETPETTLFVVVRQGTMPSSATEARTTMCTWLFPSEA